jgi:hypothetical protein
MIKEERRLNVGVLGCGPISQALISRPVARRATRICTLSAIWRKIWSRKWPPDMNPKKPTSVTKRCWPTRMSMPSLLRLPINFKHMDPLHPFAYARILSAAIPSALLKTITPKSVSAERHASDLTREIMAFTYQRLAAYRQRQAP